MQEAAPIARQLHITGRVQGVGYRWSMVQEATALGLNGWVRNRRDGSVEAYVAGPAPAVEALITWARRGPEFARVAEVRVSEAEGEGVMRGFEQWGTV